MKENEIIGTKVLISTLLYNDPYHKQGEIGTIFRADMQSDDFYVRFEDQTEGLYASNALHILKPPDELWKIVMGQKGANLTEQAQEDIRKIALLLEYGGEKSILAAYKLTAWNDAAEFFATSTLEYVLGMRLPQKMGREPRLRLPEKLTDKNLVGTCVLVQPLPWSEFPEKNWHIGKILTADIDRNKFTVQFDDASKALYSSKELIIAKSADGISEHAIRNAKEADAISYEFGERMQDYASHIEHYGEEVIREPLEMVQRDPFLQTWLTDSLDEVLRIKPSYRIGR